MANPFSLASLHKFHRKAKEKKRKQKIDQHMEMKKKKKQEDKLKKLQAKLNQDDPLEDEVLFKNEEQQPEQELNEEVEQVEDEVKEDVPTYVPKKLVNNPQPDIIVKESTVKKSKIDLNKTAKQLIPPQLLKKLNKSQMDQQKQQQAPQSQTQQPTQPLVAPIALNQNKFKEMVETKMSQNEKQLLDSFLAEISNL